MKLSDLIERRAQCDMGIHLTSYETLWVARAIFLLRRAASIAHEAEYPGFARDCEEALTELDKEQEE